MRRDSRVTTGISAFPLGWPWEAQSSPRVARESWARNPSLLPGVLGSGLPGLGTEHLPGALCSGTGSPALGLRGEAKDSALLSSRDAGLLEPPEAEGSGAGGVQTAKASRKQSSLSGKESAQGCIPQRLLGRPDEALGGGNQGVCGTRGSLRTMHGGGSAPSCCAFTHRVTFEEGQPRDRTKVSFIAGGFFTS